MTMLKKLGSALLVTLAFAGLASAQKWQALKHEPSFPVGAIALLSDGTVLLHVEQVSTQAGDWYKLTPDDTGSYLNGTMKKIASLPSGYGPWYFGSVVLPDGRYIVEGGEYNEGSSDWTNKGAIYDPVKNKWTRSDPSRRMDHDRRRSECNPAYNRGNLHAGQLLLDPDFSVHS